MENQSNVRGVEVVKDIYGRDIYFLRLGRVKGRNELMRQGFTVCGNAEYYKRDEMYAHFNSLKGVWFIETPVKTETGYLVA